MESLRVLILGLNYAPEPTGIAPYTAGVARFLDGAGHDVRVVTGFPHYPGWSVHEGYRGMRLRERDGGVRVLRVRHHVPRDPTGLGRIGMEATYAIQAAAARGPRPDVVIAVSPALFSVAAALRWRSRGRTAVGAIVQDLYGRGIAETGALGGRGAQAAERLERHLLGRVDGVVAIHDSFRRSLVAMGVDPSVIADIKNWTHTGPPTGDPAALRHALGWRDDEVVAMHAGNMGSKQGLENLVEAARIADQRRLPVRFVLLGGGHQQAHLERLGAGVERLQFLRPLPDGRFETALTAADVLVLNERPQVAEMCVPSKLTSYFAAGRPVLAATSATSTAAHEVRASGGGLVVAPGRPEDLLRAAIDLARDGARASAMGQHGQVYAAATLSEAAARDAYVAWVDDLARRRRPARSPAGPEDGVPIPSARTPTLGGRVGAGVAARRTGSS